MRFTSLHYAKINVLSSDLADPAPNNMRTRQLLTQPWKIPAVCGWIMGKWGKERCFWSEGIKLQRDRCRCWALRVLAVRANMYATCVFTHVAYMWRLVTRGQDLQPWYRFQFDTLCTTAESVQRVMGDWHSLDALFEGYTECPDCGFHFVGCLALVFKKQR